MMSVLVGVIFIYLFVVIIIQSISGNIYTCNVTTIRIKRTSEKNHIYCQACYLLENEALLINHVHIHIF